MISADTIRLLIEAGVTGEALLRIVESIEEDGNAVTERYRNNGNAVTYNAQKQARYRARKKVTEVTRVTESVTSLPPDKERSPGPPKEINPPHIHSCRARDDTAGFEEFWTAYPNKVGKPAARLKWPRALEKAELADILAGLQRYILDKPADRQWLNPATFLHQERWNDQPLYANGHSATGPPSKPMTGSAKMVELLKKPLGEIYGRNGNTQPPEPTFRTIRNG